jgi:hypothetical protein
MSEAPAFVRTEKYDADLDRNIAICVLSREDLKMHLDKILSFAKYFADYPFPKDMPIDFSVQIFRTTLSSLDLCLTLNAMITSDHLRFGETAPQSPETEDEAFFHSVGLPPSEEPSSSSGEGSA